MAQRLIRYFVDDLDGGRDDVARRRFALDGVEYEIDLSADNFAALVQSLAPYVRAGRKTHSPVAAAVVDRTVGRPKPDVVRRWLLEQGIAVSRRGRIPEHLVRRFEAEAHGGDSTVALSAWEAQGLELERTQQHEREQLDQRDRSSTDGAAKFDALDEQFARHEDEYARWQALRPLQAA